jgi:hypothetical protein
MTRSGWGASSERHPVHLIIEICRFNTASLDLGTATVGHYGFVHCDTTNFPPQKFFHHLTSSHRERKTIYKLKLT